ncbi:MAG TPA: YraN family protein [Spirochaetota bacterium]|nr:YraN family protein [Spirochaetota bacterium]HPV40933.1 YraN family protein [Spirochaetota bacterium]
MSDRFHNRNFGSDGEDRAADFLEKKQFNILERNYRHGRYGEIDIIARSGDLVVFAEVKRRGAERYGGALYSISRKKRNSLKTAAQSFLAANPEYNRPGITFRFDLISIRDNAIEWIEDMFR